MRSEESVFGYFALRYAFVALILTMLACGRVAHAEDVLARPQQGEEGLSLHPWQYGGFVQAGFPPGYKIDIFNYVRVDVQLQLVSGGLEIGKQTRRFDGFRLARGRGEAMLEFMPYWLARYPPQNKSYTYSNGQTLTLKINETFHGASITPFLLRWNFSQHDSARVVPWAQLGGGLLWTNHTFPYNYYGTTSVINFTPQVGAGVNIFNRPKHSVNFAMKAVHFSNAGLSEHNPGVKFILQFSAGYSWWK
jgi:lipid A 3-O-deacylase